MVTSILMNLVVKLGTHMKNADLASPIPKKKELNFIQKKNYMLEVSFYMLYNNIIFSNVVVANI